MGSILKMRRAALTLHVGNLYFSSQNDSPGNGCIYTQWFQLYIQTVNMKVDLVCSVSTYQIRMNKLTKDHTFMKLVTLSFSANAGNMLVRYAGGSNECSGCKYDFNKRPLHRRIKRQKGRQRSSLIFWLFDAARGGGRGYCETKF